MSLFEIVDSSSDEMYFTLGVYDDPKTAKQELLMRCGENCALTENGDDGYFEEIEIRQRELGWGKGHRVIFKVTRSKEYNDENDDNLWVNEYVSVVEGIL